MFKKFLTLPAWLLLTALLLLTIIPLWAVLHAKPSASQQQGQHADQTLEMRSNAASVTTPIPATTSTPVVTGTATTTSGPPTPTPTPAPTSTPGSNPTATVAPTATPMPTPTPTTSSKGSLVVDHPPNYGYGVTGSGSGFKPGESVSLLWDYGQPGQLLVYTTTADALGEFTYLFTAPSGPGPGNFELAAVGKQSGTVAVTNLYEHPGGILKPATASAGQQIQVTGIAFGASETVSISFKDSAGTTPLTTAHTDALGAFTASFVVPASSSPSNAIILFVGSSSKISVPETFQYTPSLTLTPNRGTTGNVVTVTGYNFTAYAAISVYWVDPSVGGGQFLTTLTVDGNGTATGTITIPNALVSGHTYYVEAQDSHTGVFVQASFTAS